jgi:hypothetical protein
MWVTGHCNRGAVSRNRYGVEKNRHYVQWPKEKKTNNDLQSIARKTKDRATRTPLKTRGRTHVQFMLHYSITVNIYRLFAKGKLQLVEQ